MRPVFQQQAVGGQILDPPCADLVEDDVDRLAPKLPGMRLQISRRAIRPNFLAAGKRQMHFGVRERSLDQLLG